MYRIRFHNTSASAGVPHSGGSLTAIDELPHPVGGNNVALPISLKKTPRVRKGSKIQNSALCPLVLASQRVPYWETPYSINSFTTLSTVFSPHLIASWKNVMLASVTEDTLKNYGAGLLRFTQFCDSFHVPEVNRMPADDALLSIFVAEMGAGKVRKTTIDSWIDGVKLW